MAVPPIPHPDQIRQLYCDNPTTAQTPSAQYAQSLLRLLGDTGRYVRGRDGKIKAKLKYPAKPGCERTNAVLMEMLVKYTSVYDVVIEDCASKDGRAWHVVRLTEK